MALSLVRIWVTSSIEVRREALYTPNGVYPFTNDSVTSSHIAVVSVWVGSTRSNSDPIILLQLWNFLDDQRYDNIHRCMAVISEGGPLGAHTRADMLIV